MYKIDRSKYAVRPRRKKKRNGLAFSGKMEQFMANYTFNLSFLWTSIMAGKGTHAYYEQEELEL